MQICSVIWLVYTKPYFLFVKEEIMRKSKWLVFLIAVILCVVSVSAAFAKVPPLEEDEADAMEQMVCKLL